LVHEQVCMIPTTEDKEKPHHGEHGRAQTAHCRHMTKKRGYLLAFTHNFETLKNYSTSQKRVWYLLVQVSPQSPTTHMWFAHYYCAWPRYVSLATTWFGQEEEEEEVRKDANQTKRQKKKINKMKKLNYRVARQALEHGIPSKHCARKNNKTSRFVRTNKSWR